jgi:23S rRNA (uracil1939-C5)-methyltransferase
MDKGPNVFFDLYCGVGVMSILANESYERCYGIEINSNSIEMANINAEKNNITNIEFMCCPVEDIISTIIEDISEDIIIFVNPPRSGLQKNVIDKLNIIKKYVKQIIYLSCSEKTLDRDLKLFDYSNKIIKKYNMFVETKHVETLAFLYNKLD